MLARSVSRLASLSRRGFAAAAAATPQKNTEELRLTFASPDTAFYNNALVKQVDVPTLAGMVGVLANHEPTIGVLKPGVVTVSDMEGKVFKLFVSSGTLSVNIDGTCQSWKLLNALLYYGSDLSKAEASIRVEVADALLKAATGQQ
ncbi:hypothetical protein Aduo_011635 [Ancylostoma duodenale]